MKKIDDLSPFTNVLPYASELFGVYQPLLGWRSRKLRLRMERGFANDLSHVYKTLSRKFRGRFEFQLNEDRTLREVRKLEPAVLSTEHEFHAKSFVVESIARRLPPIAEYAEAIWDQLIQSNQLETILTKVVVPEVTEWYKYSSDPARRVGRTAVDDLNAMLADQLNRESSVAGYLLYLTSNKLFEKLKDIFYTPDKKLVARIVQLVQSQNPLDVFDPFKDLDRVGLSPIGIVHLFREYLYEFDTFLGPPASHVWLSPGSTVELVEISTRRTLVERTFESTFETTIKTEKALTEEDEISDAVKQDNRSDTKFGMSATVEQSWVGGSATASTSLDMATTQGKAREQAHRHMRQQTEKLSTEIRKNYKATFKTVTEVTDTSSKRYVLNNTTQHLINYELRRKLRQVGVQVQDIGTYLCWQTYVDDPGRQLGIAKLVHIAKSPEVGAAPQPDGLPVPPAITTDVSVEIQFIPMTEDTLPDEDMGEAYRNGREVNLEDHNEGSAERIEDDFGPYTAVCEQPGYQFGTLVFDYGGKDIQLSLRHFVEEPAGKVQFDVHVDYVNFRDVSPIIVVAKVTWQPVGSVIEDINAQNRQRMDEFNEQKRYEFQKAFVDAARERIRLASEIVPRKFEDLREEERIVVYRSLMQDMLTKDLPMPDDRTRHVVSELLNTIFDIDKMLYFVAPEWWRPRLHRSHQALGGIRDTTGGATAKPAPPAGETVFDNIQLAKGKFVVDHVLKPQEDSTIAPMDVVTWGGAHENRVDNYYITDESEPARLGSSLGWLLQLDGDNMRNAFLNAPWVKAVLPIRPGRERAAINWLQRLHVEGTEGLEDKYLAPPEQLQQIPHQGPFATVRDAISHLCDVVARKHADSLKVNRYPTEEINDDNRVSSTPIDKVYEHGFYPLQGGFRVLPGTEDFEVFDQWVEVLPTDQVVPVEVTYDPKTGRQV